MAETEKKNEHLEAQSRRKNLKFYRINDEQGKSWELSDAKVREYLTLELNINVSVMGIERAHRLPSRSSPHPNIVKFSSFKDKDRVLKKYRQCHAVRVSEDFPKQVTEVQVKLYLFLKQCCDNETEVYLPYDRLIVNGQSYIYNFDLGRLVPAM